jgi:UDP-N-acetylmuramoyl-tripeptide--D-alanyl-D-alanine ligase
VPANNRSQILQQASNTFILDAYNANPSSMEAALRSFAVMEAPQKVAILGDMLELGAASEKEHQAMLRLAARTKPDRLIVVGAEFGKTDHARYKAQHFATAADARAWFAQQNWENTLFLLKGSRGIKLETILS